MHLNFASHAHENKKASGHAPESGKKVKENGRERKESGKSSGSRERERLLSEIGQKTRSHGGNGGRIAKKILAL